MNDKQMDKKVRQDVDKVKKDLGMLMKDSAARFNRFESSVSIVNENAQKDLFTWVEETVSQLSKDIDKLTGGAKDTVVGAAASMKKDIGHQLNQAQKVVDKAPDNIGKKAAKYPWVAVSICLAVGVVLGFVIKPTRHLLAEPQI